VTVTCKRCGDVGHYAKTCPFPPIGRPNLERLRDRLKGTTAQRGERLMQRKRALDVFDTLLVYVSDLEAARRSLLTHAQAELSTPHTQGER